MSLIIITGPSRSGKSKRAENLARATEKPVYYIATGASTDEEMAERIHTHQHRRPGHWDTIENNNLAEATQYTPAAATILIDDFDGWITERMNLYGLWTNPPNNEQKERLVDQANALGIFLSSRDGDTIIVAGQPGWGLVSLESSTRTWTDLHGELLQQLCTHADTVELVIAGRVLPLPPQGNS